MRGRHAAAHSGHRGRRRRHRPHLWHVGEGQLARVVKGLGKVGEAHHAHAHAACSKQWRRARGRVGGVVQRTARVGGMAGGRRRGAHTQTTPAARLGGPLPHLPLGAPPMSPVAKLSTMVPPKAALPAVPSQPRPPAGTHNGGRKEGQLVHLHCHPKAQAMNAARARGSGWSGAMGHRLPLTPGGLILQVELGLGVGGAVGGGRGRPGGDADVERRGLVLAGHKAQHVEEALGLLVHHVNPASRRASRRGRGRAHTSPASHMQRAHHQRFRRGLQRDNHRDCNNDGTASTDRRSATAGEHRERSIAQHRTTAQHPPTHR